MKLLFDQNISFRIVKLIIADFPLSAQVRTLGLENSSDIDIFKFARVNEYTVVTFDADFINLNVVYGVPPKIIWLKTGNLTTKSISKLLERNKLQICTLIQSSEIEILEISDTSDLS